MQALLRLVESDERAPETAGQLLLVRGLPRLEIAEELHEQAVERLRDAVGDVGEVPDPDNLRDDLLEAGQQGGGRVEQRLLELIHGLEGVGRLAHHHVCGHKHPGVHILRVGLYRATASVAEAGDPMDALEARLRGENVASIAELDDQGVEAAHA